MSVDTLISQYGVSAAIRRPTATVDATGSVVNAYTTTVANTTIYLQQTGGSEAGLLGAPRNTLNATGYIGVGLGVQPQDRVFIGTVYWDIQEVRTPDERASSNGVAHTRLALTRTLPL